MKHPPYHLRPNKAVDRFLLKEVIDKMLKLYPGNRYRYFGFGGPFMEDFRLLCQFYPSMEMESIEENEETFKRQKFHKPTKNVKLTLKTSREFVENYHSEVPGLFWLDNTDGRMAEFNDFMILLGRAGVGSLLKITLAAEPKKFVQRDGETIEVAEARHVQEFRGSYPDVVPAPLEFTDLKSENYTKTLQNMVKIASERVFPPETQLVFQLVQSCYYHDSTIMLSVVGVICTRNEIGQVKNAFKGLQFENFNWKSPEHLDVPLLSTKERLKLERFLPIGRTDGAALARALGYSVGHTPAWNKKMMRQYSDFYRYLPHYIKALP